MKVQDVAFFKMKKLLKIGNYDLSDVVDKLKPHELGMWIKYILNKKDNKSLQTNDPWKYLAGEKKEREKKEYQN